MTPAGPTLYNGGKVWRSAKNTEIFKLCKSFHYKASLDKLMEFKTRRSACCLKKKHPRLVSPICLEKTKEKHVTHDT